MREEVKKFAEEMEKVLHENDNKGGWKDCNITYLYNSLNTEIEGLKYLIESKLIDKIDQFNSVQNYAKNIQKELIDIANYCMMIHERLDDKIFV